MPNPIVGTPPRRLDWLVLKGVPVVGDFRRMTRVNGNKVAQEFEPGTTAILEVEYNGSFTSYPAVFTGNQMLFVIPLSDSQAIPHLADFRVYIQFPNLDYRVFWSDGIGIREGW